MVAFEQYLPGLTPLPGTAQSWAALSREQRARIELAMKATDTSRYQQLRAQAIRCAR